MFYIISIILLLVIFIVDAALSLILKNTTTKQNIIWVCVCILFSIGFFAALLIYKGHIDATNYMTGYLTELSLSIDNVFIFFIIIQKYKIPLSFQREVLTFGIAIAFIARLIFIFLGIGLINKFDWISYFLAILLFYTGIHMIFTSNQKVKEGKIMKYFKKHFQSTKKFEKNGKLFVKIHGKRYLTPVFFAIIFIGTVDIMFAIDSIPAALGITKDLFIVIAINFFALFGLRQMYFLIQQAIAKIKSLHYALCIILVFIGVKIIIESLNENKLSFINSGQPLHLIHISAVFTFIFIIFCLLSFVLFEKLSFSRLPQKESLKKVSKQKQ